MCLVKAVKLVVLFNHWLMPYKVERGRQSFQCGTTKMPKVPKVQPLTLKQKMSPQLYFKIWLQFVKLNVNAQDKTSFRVILRTSQEWTFSREEGINIAGVLWYRQSFRNFFGGNCEQGINKVPFGTFNCSSSVNPSPTNHIYKIVECLGVEIK